MDLVPSLGDLVEPRRTAIVVVDVQNDFCDPVFAPASVAMLPVLQRLLREARRVGVPVIYTQAIHSAKTDTPVWLSRYATRPNRMRTCIEGTPGAEIHPDVAPEPGDLVVVKHRYSAFIGTEFEVMLHALGTSTLVFTGIATHVCVESTLRDAFQRDYWTVVLSDCTATTSPARHLGSLEVIAQNFGVVSTSEDVIAAWQPAMVLAGAV